MSQVSGRPKAGEAPVCADTGPCVARRVRSSSGPRSRCRNCSKPLINQSLRSWIQSHAPDQSVDQVLGIYKHAYPNSNLMLTSTTATCDMDAKAAQKWLRRTLQLGAVEETFRPRRAPLFNLADFAYCRRHATVPTKMRLASLLDASQFKQAAQLIRGYEQTHGQRLVNARQYYNTHVRKHNQS